MGEAEGRGTLVCCSAVRFYMGTRALGLGQGAALVTRIDLPVRAAREGYRNGFSGSQ